MRRFLCEDNLCLKTLINANGIGLRCRKELELTLKQHLNWQAVILLKVHLQIQASRYAGLTVDRCYLAEHPDGIVMTGWNTKADERDELRIRLIGWKPERDVPFVLPVKFQRDDPRIDTLIQRGSWVLPYEEDLYQHYLSYQQKTQILLQQIDANPMFIGDENL